MSSGGTDSIALAAFAFGLAIVMVVTVIAIAAVVPFRLLHRFMAWASGDDV